MGARTYVHWEYMGWWNSMKFIGKYDNTYHNTFYVYEELYIKKIMNKTTC